MRYSQATAILQLSGLSPEQLAPMIGVSNMTYRRWLKRKESDDSSLSKLHEIGVRRAISILQKRGLLSASVVDPAYTDLFDALGDTIKGSVSRSFADRRDFEANLLQTLTRIGSQPDSPARIEDNLALIEDFQNKSPLMRSTISFLVDTVHSQELTRVAKSIACGALLYLLIPLDMMPDFTVGLGYIDDYGIIALAAAFCREQLMNPQTIGQETSE